MCLKTRHKSHSTFAPPDCISRRHMSSSVSSRAQNLSEKSWCIWDLPTQDASHHQDDMTFLLENPDLNLHLWLKLWVGGIDPRYIFNPNRSYSTVHKFQLTLRNRIPETCRTFAKAHLRFWQKKTWKGSNQFHQDVWNKNLVWVFMSLFSLTKLVGSIVPPNRAVHHYVDLCRIWQKQRKQKFDDTEKFNQGLFG